MKTVTFDDDAYALLRGHRTNPQESFSHVVKRLLGKRRGLAESTGGWDDMTAKEAKALRQELVDAFGTTR